MNCEAQTSKKPSASTPHKVSLKKMCNQKADKNMKNEKHHEQDKTFYLLQNI